MAIFKPETRTVEGSNIGTYNPPTVDYSGALSSIGANIGSGIQDMFNSRGGKGSGGPTEGEKEELAFAQLAKDWDTASQIEEPVRMTVTLNKIEQSAYSRYAGQIGTEKLRAWFAEQKGFVYENVGQDPSRLNQANIVNWASTTDEGKYALGITAVEAKGDPILQDTLLAKAYYEDLSFKAEIAAKKKQVENVEADEKIRKSKIATAVLPDFSKRVSDKYNKLVNEDNILLLLNEAKKEGIDPISYLENTLLIEEESMKASLIKDATSMGIDANELNIDNLVYPFTSRRKAYESQKDLFTRSFKTMTDQQIAKGLAASNTSAFISKLVMDGGPIIQNEVLNNPQYKEQFIAVLDAGLSIGSKGGFPDVSETNLTSPSIGDSEAKFKENYRGIATEQDLSAIWKASQANPDALIAAGKMGENTITNYKYNPDVPENTEGAFRKLGAMYLATLPEVDKDGSSYKSASTKKLLSDAAFRTITEINRTNPEMGKDIFTKMNTYASNSALMLTERFFSNVNNLRDTEFMPFIIEMDEAGTVNLAVNPEAIRYDQNLKKAMGALSFQTLAKGNVRTTDRVATVTDPFEILDNYVSLAEGGNAREIKDIIESLRIISMQSQKIPSDVRAKVDPIVLIKQRVSMKKKK